MRTELHELLNATLTLRFDHYLQNIANFKGCDNSTVVSKIYYL